MLTTHHSSDDMQQGPPSPTNRRERSASAPFLPAAPRPAKRTRFALADSSTELSNEAVLSWRDGYAHNMAELRDKEQERQVLRRAITEGIGLPFAPGYDCKLQLRMCTEED